MPIYMQIPGIAGDSTNALHPHTFELMSYSWGGSRAISTTGGGRGRVTFTEVTVMMPLQFRTPELMLAVVDARNFSTAAIFDSIAGGTAEYDILQIDFSHVSLASWFETSNGDLPAVQLTFRYGAVTVTTQFPNADGRLQSDSVNWTTSFRG
ncbi:MAG: type VI secretion system tube protein Hcp [Fimbriimonadaceae bacterium]